MNKLKKFKQIITIEIEAYSRFTIGNKMIDVRKFINTHIGIKKIKESNVEEEEVKLNEIKMGRRKD